MGDKLQVVIVVGGALALKEIEAIKSRIPGAAVVRAVKVEDIEMPSRENERPFIVFDEAHFIPATPIADHEQQRTFKHTCVGWLPEPLDFEREVLQMPIKSDIAKYSVPVARYFEKPDRIPVPASYKRNRFPGRKF